MAATVECRHDVHSAVPATTQAFDPDTTFILGQAFDMACALLGHTAQPTAVREAIAESIIKAAKAGERDPVRLRDAGLAALSASIICHREILWSVP